MCVPMDRYKQYIAGIERACMVLKICYTDEKKVIPKIHTYVYRYTYIAHYIRLF